VIRLRAGGSGVRIPAGVRDVFSKSFGRGQGSTQPPSRWKTGPFLGVNRPGHEVGHSPSSRAEVKDCLNN
jgi:hypothetical protein